MGQPPSPSTHQRTSNFETNLRSYQRSKYFFNFINQKKLEIIVRIRLQLPKIPEFEVPTPPQPQREPEFHFILPLKSPSSPSTPGS
jgi:hypothetical protein